MTTHYRGGVGRAVCQPDPDLNPSVRKQSWICLSQNPLLDVPWRGCGQLDLLGVPFTSLKEQVDSKVS